MSDDLGNLYGVNGEVYEFIREARGWYNKRGFIGLAHQAQELLMKIEQHDREVVVIARRVTEECKV